MTKLKSPKKYKENGVETNGFYFAQSLVYNITTTKKPSISNKVFFVIFFTIRLDSVLTVAV